jgi:hypothetical protein
MMADGAVLNGGPGVGVTFRPYNIIFKGNTTVFGDWVRAAVYMEIYPTHTVTIAAGSHLVLDSWATFAWYNDGVVAGPGVFTIQVYQTVALCDLGTIAAPVEMTMEPITSDNPTLTLAQPFIVGSSLSIWGYNTHTIILDTDDYPVVATGIYLGPLTLVYPGTSDIFNYGDWYSANGTFTQGSSTIYQMGGRAGGIMAAWHADANYTTLEFSVTNLVENHAYEIWIDGVLEDEVVAGEGTISFPYSGPWSDHSFIVRDSSIAPNLGPAFAVIGFVWVSVFSILAGAGLLVYLRYGLHGD